MDALRTRAGTGASTSEELAVEVFALPEGGKGSKVMVRCAAGIADGDVVFWPAVFKEDEWARVG